MLVFRKGKYFFAPKFNVTSKKSVSIRFVSKVVESPSFLNIAIISFLILSNFGPFALFSTANPLTLYKPTLLLSITVPN